MANFNWPVSASSSGPVQFNKDGVLTPVATDSGTPANNRPLPVGLWNGANQAAVDASGGLTIGTSALPTGGSTSALQTTGNTSLGSIDTKLTGVATAANQATGNTSLGSIDTKLTSQATAANQATANTSLSSIDGKLTGVATAANQSTGNTSLASIDTKLSSQATAANQATGNTSLGSIDTKLSSQATAANQATANTSLGSIDTKLSSQATAANQATANTSLASIDTKLTSPIGTKSPVNTAGSHATGNATASAATLTKPANCIGFVLQAADTNSANIRWRADGTNPTAAAGMQLQPGRDTGFIPIAHDVAVITESGTQEYEIHWVMSA